jgi:hypothetical protein
MRGPNACSHAIAVLASLSIVSRVWLSQKMMAQLYDVEVPTINYHLKKVFEDSELEKDSVIRNFQITAADGKTCRGTQVGGNARSATPATLEDTSSKLTLIATTAVSDELPGHRMITFDSMANTSR